ncbi:DUF6338 family protein [Streptomyces sp. NPDC051014]|uniref:DUF6338 family protein n=1 Tax=Streptomyces sp. NPDC051014 TaxID=3155751 RepID=UPI0033C6F1D7
MGEAPSTVAQLGLIVMAVLPGVTYQLVRERRLGSEPGEQVMTERVLRALAASVALDSLYAVILAPWIVRGIGGEPRLTENPAQLRWAGAMCLTLVFLLPAGTAWLVSAVRLKRRQGTYVGTPSAWDQVFRNLPPSYIRVRLKDGTWVGGWYGPGSFATAYPRPPELYLELAWEMGRDGSFIAAVQRTQGVLINSSEFDILEILEN